MQGQSRSESPANEIARLKAENDRLQKGFDASLAKVTDLQGLIQKADTTIAAKDTELNRAYETIGSLKAEREFAQSGLTKSQVTVDKLADTIVKQTTAITEQAQDKAKTEVELENAKKSAGRWRTAAGVTAVIALLSRVLN